MSAATTIYLYDTLVNAMAGGATGRVNITNVGSGNHTLTCTLQARALADTFGTEIHGAVPSHRHSWSGSTDDAGASPVVTVDASADMNTSGPDQPTELTGQTEGVTNMPPSVVVNFIIKT